MNDSRNFDPKHRIIGAVIVVSLAVIFVPMILDRRESPAEVTTAGRAAAPATADERKVVVTPVRPEPPTETSKPDKTLAPPTPVPAADAAAAEPKAPAKAAAAKPAPIRQGWVVQVGTYSNSANATRLEEQLKKHGHTVKVERIVLDSGNALRLRVGPFRDRPLAVKAQAQIHKQVGVQGVVLAYP